MQSDESASSKTTRRPGPPRVLVVDDDPAIRLVCSTNLQLDGYQVLEAANGQEGLELALDHVPDVVLLEISMPVLDGFGLAAALQANERTRELPLIFLTTEVDPLIKAKAFETGAHAVITKPFEPRAVTSFIERVVAQVVPRRRLSVVDPSS
jgi:CheY-like chemotaxis protein